MNPIQPLSGLYFSILLVLTGIGGTMKMCGNSGQGSNNHYIFSVIYLNYDSSSDGSNTGTPLNMKFLSDETYIRLGTYHESMSRYFSHQGSSVLRFVREGGRGRDGKINHVPF